MAWFAAASTDTVDLVCSEDPCVEAKDEYEEATMLTRDQCKKVKDGASVYTVRPLTWIESQRFDGSTPAETIDGICKLALVAVDGDEKKADEAKERLHPKLAVPLCVAIQSVTWGSFT
tara:strand:+ start:380 stop:733 length:354 start_codon:yes stop_codon:yes gene_type:complete